MMAMVCYTSYMTITRVESATNRIKQSRWVLGIAAGLKQAAPFAGVGFGVLQEARDDFIGALPELLRRDLFDEGTATRETLEDELLGIAASVGVNLSPADMVLALGQLGLAEDRIFWEIEIPDPNATFAGRAGHAVRELVFRMLVALSEEIRAAVLADEAGQSWYQTTLSAK
jgi:hypothetical protein